MTWCEANGISYIPACSRIAAKVGTVMPDLRSGAPPDRDIPACSSAAKVGPVMPDLRSGAPADRDIPACSSAAKVAAKVGPVMPDLRSGAPPDRDIFGLAGTKPLGKKVEDVADAIRTERAVQGLDVVRGFAETRHRAGSWTRSRRVVARIEATTLGLDRRYVVTSIETGTAEWLCDSLYCARGQAENLIKLHKTQLASDRTSCRSPSANQVRLVLHTAPLLLVWTAPGGIDVPE